MKTCIKCKLKQPLKAFNVDIACKDGRRGVCSTCMKATQKEWYKNNTKSLVVKARIKRLANPENAMLARARQRSRIQNLNFNLELTDILIPACCPILHIPLKMSENKGPSRNSPSLDRIVPSLGYVKGNVQVISNQANFMKSDASPKELLDFSKWIIENIKEINDNNS